MRINIIGDSHTAALGPKLERLLKSDDVWYRSYPGYSTARVTEELNAVRVRPADWTIVILGGNDFGARSGERLELLRWLESQYAGKVLWVGPAYAEDKAVNTRHYTQSVSQHDQFKRIGVHWMDSYPYTTANHRQDGVHFNDAGYTTWAKAIANHFNGLRRKNVGIAVAMWSAIAATVGWIFHKTLRLGDRR